MKDGIPTTGKAWALLSADTDETQSYVFESNKLPEIRGASRQLDDLNRRLGNYVAKYGECIYADGGSLLAIVPQDQAQEITDTICRTYPQETGAATITAVWRTLPPTYETENFGSLVGWASHWLRQAKESKTDLPPFYETLPHQVRCQSCQKRPVDGRSLNRSRNEPEWLVCTVCWNKSRYLGRTAWFTDFEEAVKRQPALHPYYQGYNADTITHPQSVSQIAAASHSQKEYVAVVYLDGNAIGRLFGDLQNKDQYQQLSHHLRDTTRQAVFAALARHLRPTATLTEQNQKTTIHPFEILTIGGDDVLLIVPAHAAIPIAVQIGTTFGQQVSDKMKQPVSMSAGVVIAEEHTPIRLLRDLARQLLKQAKKEEGGRIDFHVLKSADMLDRKIDKVRSHHPYTLAQQGSKKLRLLGRPYSYEQMSQLWGGLQKLKADKFVTSQLHLLADSLLEGRAASTLFYQYQMRRDRNGYYQTMSQLLNQLQGSSTQNPLPWQMVQDPEYSHQTAAWDVAELYDFVPKTVE